MQIEAQASPPRDALEAAERDSLPPAMVAILDMAVTAGASHVHIEPSPRGMTLRLRIAGVLAAPCPLGWDEGQAFSACLQTFVDEDAPLRHEGREIAVAALPVASGTRFVLRLAGAPGRSAALEALGMRPQLAADLHLALGRGGLVLVAGPAQSGRSTTLSALLRLLADESRSLLAITAHPLPPLPGLSQVMAPPGLAMATTLAGAVAQDADAIAVDALEDRAATARAVDAAEAGNLVIAAIEAPDAVGAVRRLRDWRVEPFQLASNLRFVLAQRLVRRLCPDCRIPTQAQGSVSALLGFDPGAIVYSAAGCGSCDGQGYAGETAVFEAIHADAAIRRLINDGGDGAILARHAFIRAPNLGSAARRLVREGVTTPEEAVRLSRS